LLYQSRHKKKHPQAKQDLKEIVVSQDVMEK
jgi:hypothetical protein